MTQSNFLGSATGSPQAFLVAPNLKSSTANMPCLAGFFVTPRMWAVHASLLCNVLTGVIPISGKHFTERNSQDVRQALLNNVSDIKRRNEAMLSAVSRLIPLLDWALLSLTSR